MGLDCYIVHANNRDEPFTYKDDERLKDINLCGGMLSGSGSDGSFRGKAYEPLLDELMNTMGIWHKDEDDDYIVPTDELKEQAIALSELIESIEEINEADNRKLSDEDIVYITKDGWAEYNYKEVKDLETLLRAASESKAVMHVWW